jgi:hypothetical protein
MSNLQNVLRRLTPRTPFLLLAAALASGAAPAARAEGPNVRLPEKPADVRKLESVRLATFRIGNVSEVRIVAVPEIKEISVMEVIPAGGDEKFVLKPGLSPAEVFHLLAPADAAVPEAIVATDRRHLLADRALVAALDAPIEIAPARLGLKPRLATKAGSGSCQGGAAGADYFEDNHCGTLGGPGYGSSESYCDKDAADWIQRTSSSTRRATYTRMASCGSGTNRLRHSTYYTVGGWDTQVDEDFSANQVISWWSYVDGIKRDRRARFEENSDGGWVRGWTKYHSEAAEGW